jgi:hypothetical protein
MTKLKELGTGGLTGSPAKHGVFGSTAWEFQLTYGYGSIPMKIPFLGG